MADFPALLPFPQSLKIQRGWFNAPSLDPTDSAKAICSNSAPDHPEGYSLTIDHDGIKIEFREKAGLRAANATLRQLVRQYGRKLPCLEIRDWPDFPRRGVMLDVSRGRVPKLETLLDLVERLADFKINEFQLYFEHTFAYRKYKPVWRNWGALTATEIRKLDARCRQLGIDLVPNQNSFGHLRYLLEYPPLKKLAEVSAPYESADGSFLRYPTTLAPNHPGTIPFLRSLYDELLPNFSSEFFDVGCDETWDLGRGQSKLVCERIGKGRVYLEFLKRIHREVYKRGRKMMFWGDIVLHYPELIRELPKDVIALNWGYEADHPFEREAGEFARAKIPFYVCPGTSTWQTMIGKHVNALANMRAAAKAGKKFNARGYLITDWGDGGHPQPLAVSWPMLVAGAALAWNLKSFDQGRRRAGSETCGTADWEVCATAERKLVPILSRDVFEDSTERVARAAFRLGMAHRRLGVQAPNETPLGSVIAAPQPDTRELFCRNGLKWFSKIPAGKIRTALKAIQTERLRLSRAKPESTRSKILVRELELAARMAEQSCKFMLWQQANVAGRNVTARKLARTGVRELKKLKADFNALWPVRNKATSRKCAAFLEWRIRDYQQQTKRTASKKRPKIERGHFARSS